MKFFTPVFAAFVAIAFADDNGDDQDTKDKITSKAGDAVSDVKSGASAATSKAASAAGGDGDDKDKKSSSSGAGAGTLGMAVGAVGLAGALLL